MDIQCKQRRPRVSKGILVYSTNSVQQGCIRSLVIVHYYGALNYKRIKRIVEYGEEA